MHYMGFMSLKFYVLMTDLLKTLVPFPHIQVCELKYCPPPLSVAPASAGQCVTLIAGLGRQKPCPWGKHTGPSASEECNFVACRLSGQST